MKQLDRVVLVTLAIMATSAARADAANLLQQPAAGHCVATLLRVSLAPGQPAKQKISGTLCSPTKPNRTRAIDVLVHGATYDRSYWDSRFESPQYSYVERTLEAGRATFSYDR